MANLLFWFHFCCDKYPGKGNIKEEKAYLAYDSRSQSIISVKSRQEIKQQVLSIVKSKESEHMDACLLPLSWLSPPPPLSLTV